MEQIMLNSIGGYNEEKLEALKIINIFKNYNKYKENGAYIPKGLILSGEPGVGKTMLAEAIANEANVPFFIFDNEESENEGVAIKNLKAVFKKAKENAPSIVFIDEVDDLVSCSDFMSDFSRKTLKTLLTEIDGINKSDGVMVIATTNYKSHLPKSLVRSGRMDRQIEMDIPNLKEREEILGIYLKDKAISFLDPHDLATKTPNFSGADIKTLINELIFKFVDTNTITDKDIDEVLNKIRFSNVGKLPKNEPADSVCYHELGHFICSYVVRNEIANISTESFGPVKGYILFDEDEDNESDGVKSRTDLNNEIVIALGGLASENVFLGEPFSGSISDIAKAKQIIMNMLESGMYGFKTYVAKNMMGMYFTEEGSKLSNSILSECYDKATTIINNNKDIIMKLLPELKSKMRLSKREITEILAL